jgi:hypothetical protein
MCAHQDQLLPDWSAPISTVVIVLQASTISLLPHTANTEALKDELRQRFFEIGLSLVQELQTHGYQAELFDPKTGWPFLSAPGAYSLDDVAVVKALLGYPVVDHQGCWVTLHPTWQAAVYPSTVVTSAPASVVATLLATI